MKQSQPIVLERLSTAQTALLCDLPDAPSDGQLCKGPRLNTALALATRGLARCVGVDVSLYWFVRTERGRNLLLAHEKRRMLRSKP